MKLTTEQDSYYGASEYTEPRGCGGNKPDPASKTRCSLFVIMILFWCSICGLVQLGLEAAGL